MGEILHEVFYDGRIVWEGLSQGRMIISGSGKQYMRIMPVSSAKGLDERAQRDYNQLNVILPEK